MRAQCATQRSDGCSRRFQGERKDRHRDIGSSPPARIQPVSKGCPSWTRPLASSSTRNDRRTAPMASGRDKWGRLTACSMRSAVQDRIIGPRIQPGLRRFACPGVRPPPSASLDWRRRTGPAGGRPSVFPAGLAISQHYSPADLRSRLAPPKSRSFPCERAVQFISSDAKGVTHHSPGSRSAPWEFPSENRQPAFAGRIELT